MTPRFQQALEALYGRERHKEKLGLDGTRALLAALGDPHRRFRSVHVAGTNGKGSVCAMVERVLREAGYRTGLFTSPHLVDFRERIRVSGRWVDAEWLERTLDRIAALPEGQDRTFFEVCTALAFAYFAEQGVEWAVVEVGLGGRLDCTNVLEPAVTAITSIGLDHTEILGDTIEQIAAEKAGIIKAGVPLVTSEELVHEVIASVARERGAPLELACLAAPVWRAAGALRAVTDSWGEIALEAHPNLVPRNVSCALAVLDRLVDREVTIPKGAVTVGIPGTRWPGRFERCPSQPRLWWDGAHNTAGMETLAELWASAGLEPAEALVIAVSRDKDLTRMLEPLRRIARSGRLFASRSRSERALAPEALAATAMASGWSPAVVFDVSDACREALNEVAATVLLTGSLFAVGEAMEAFGGAPGEWL